MKKELETKNNLLSQFYNLSKKVDELTNENFITEFKKIFIDNLYKFNESFTPKQRKNIILKSFKNSLCKNPLVKDNQVILYNYNNNNYEVITDGFYMVFAPINYYNFLEIDKTENENKQKAITTNKLYKNNEEIESLPIKFTFIVNEVLNEFNFVDTVAITNDQKQTILLKKDCFINFVCATGLKPYKKVTLHGVDTKKPFYYYDDEITSLLIPLFY